MINIFMLNFNNWLESTLKDDQNIRVGNYLKSVADSIKEIAGTKTVVILGRDAWFLIPLLKQRGIRTQYFLFSRLQVNDSSTKEAWLREVPRGSIVIDTGYEGSIINAIRKFDPSVRGYLLSSSGHYPEIKTSNNKQDAEYLVGDIETTPKLIDRSRRYNNNYNAEVAKGETGDSGSRRYSTSAKIMATNKEILIKAGLSPEVAEKYKNFTGIPMHQRIGSKDYVTHLMRVEKSREKVKLDLKEKFEIVLARIEQNKSYHWDWDSIPKYILKGIYKDCIDMIDEKVMKLNSRKHKLTRELKVDFDQEHFDYINHQLNDIRRQKKIFNKLRENSVEAYFRIRGY